MEGGLVSMNDKAVSRGDSELEALLSEQGRTDELLGVLKKRLNPVSNRVPIEGNEKQTASAAVAPAQGHIVDAVQNAVRHTNVIQVILEQLAI